jgi:hypothetical protein
MPPIYFHGNYTRWRVHINAVRKSAVSPTKQIVPHSHRYCLFIFATDQQESACCQRKNLHQWREPTFSQMRWRRICQRIQDSCGRSPGTWAVPHINVATAETHHPLPHCAHIHCLVSANVQQASMNVKGGNFFFAWRNSMTRLCFIRNSMSDVILLQCKKKK